jgi:hypothetical protein
MNHSIKEKEVLSPNNSKEKTMLCNIKTLKEIKSFKSKQRKNKARMDENRSNFFQADCNKPNKSPQNHIIDLGKEKTIKKSKFSQFS